MLCFSLGVLVSLGVLPEFALANVSCCVGALCSSGGETQGPKQSPPPKQPPPYVLAVSSRPCGGFGKDGGQKWEKFDPWVWGEGLGLDGDGD